MAEVCRGERVSSQHGAMGEIFSIPNNGCEVAEGHGPSEELQHAEGPEPYRKWIKL
jgi:hypothetical protein